MCICGVIRGRGEEHDVCIAKLEYQPTRPWLTSRKIVSIMSKSTNSIHKKGVMQLGQGWWNSKFSLRIVKIVTASCDYFLLWLFLQSPII